MLDDKKLIEAAEAYVKYGSQRKAAKSLGISRRTFRNRLDRFNAINNPVEPGFKITKISKTLNKDGEVVGKSIVTKLAPSNDHLKRDGKVVRRSTLYGADGSVVGEWVIRKPEEAQDDFIRSLDEYFTKEVKPIPAPVLQTEKFIEGDMTLFMSIDEHINVKVLSDQCGQDYGLKDAENLMYSKFIDMVRRTPKTKKAVYVNLGDQFHENDHMRVTPASKHELDTDKSSYTASDSVVGLTMARIDHLLSHYEEVEIYGVSGNHDIDPMGWLFRCIEIAYRNEPRVTVKFYPNELFAYQHGNTLLGFHHGHRMKPEVMAGNVADRFSDMYGQTKMRYLHTGHVHHDTVKDLWGGFKWHSHRTMAPKDWYSHSNGYISRQSMKSYVYNDKEGEVANFTVSLI